MNIHEKIEKSIDLNIIVSANVTKVCKEFDIKLIIFQQTMFILAQKVITKRPILCCQ